MSRKRDYNAGAESTQAQSVQQRVRQMLIIERLCSRMPLIAQHLQKRHADRETLRIKDEFDLWDLLNALLLLEHDDVRAETWTPAYSNQPRRDFLLKIEHTILIAKMAQGDAGENDLALQLPVDIEHYSNRPDCQTFVYFIYDPEGLIPHPSEMEHNLSGDPHGLIVRVIIAPKAH